MRTKVIDLVLLSLNVDSSLTQISSADLLQADVTIIAGVLVFLTISVFYETKTRQKLWEEPLLWIAGMPIGFVISTALLVGASLDSTNLEFYGYAILFFVFGLVFLMVSTLIIIGMIIKNKRKKQPNKEKNET